MSYGILLVDAQRDILRQLRSALQELPGSAELRVVEAASGEEALLAAAGSPIDLLVAENQLPGMSGTDLMRRFRSSRPEVSVILLTAQSDSETRRQMLHQGALAVFEKPVPHGDFLAAVQRALGLEEPAPSLPSSNRHEGRHARISDLLANFRQDHAAAAVLLLDEHGSVLVRAGELPDRGSEASLLSALAAVHAASISLAGLAQQARLDARLLFVGGGVDLIFAPITPLHALLVAGPGLAGPERLKASSESISALGAEIQKSLAQIGVTDELKAHSAARDTGSAVLSGSPADPNLDSLLSARPSARDSRSVDTFWEQAVGERGAGPLNPDALTYEQAKKMGLVPDRDDE